jgi:hypothetical protein
MRNTNKIFFGKPKGKRSLGKPRCTWEDNIKMNHREIECVSVDWILVAQDGDR